MNLHWTADPFISSDKQEIYVTLEIVDFGGRQIINFR